MSESISDLARTVGRLLRGYLTCRVLRRHRIAPDVAVVNGKEHLACYCGAHVIVNGQIWTQKGPTGRAVY